MSENKFNQSITEYFNSVKCEECSNKCDDLSRMKYIFEDDIKFAAAAENEVCEFINNQINGFLCENIDKYLNKFDPLNPPTNIHKYLMSNRKGLPDLIVLKGNNPRVLIEVKSQKRTFMKIREMLNNHALYPKESVALNRSDLFRYFKINKEVVLDLYVIWRIERPCIGVSFFYNKIENLERVYKSTIDNKRTYGDNRSFRRKSGKGDVNEKGEHKGVVLNYHFLLSELKPLGEFISEKI